jgi:DNA-binding NtrC family response regulator
MNWLSPFVAYWIVKMADATKHSMLVVDDDPEMAELIGLVARAMDYDVRVAFSALKFMELYNEDQPNVIVMDIVVPEMDGIEMLEWLMEKGCRAAIILISGHGRYYTRTAAHLATLQGADILGTLTKPFALKDLEVLLRQVSETHAPQS